MRVAGIYKYHSKDTNEDSNEGFTENMPVQLGTPYGESEESEGNDPYDDLPMPVIVMPDDIVFLE